MSLGFDTTGETLIATCVKEVNFFTWADGKIKCKKGTGWGTTACDTILSQEHLPAGAGVILAADFFFATDFLEASLDLTRTGKLAS